MLSAHEISTLFVAFSSPDCIDVSSADLHALESKGLLCLNRQIRADPQVHVLTSARTIVTRLRTYADKKPSR